MDNNIQNIKFLILKDETKNNMILKTKEKVN